jgi:hypothetical protein
MAETFYKLIPTLSDSELEKYVADYESYTSQAVEAAFVELQKRGKGISEQEVAAIRQKISQRQSKRVATDEIADPQAPILYSRAAVWGFSIVMTPMFGSVLFSMNLVRVGRMRHIFPTVLFGFLWFFAGTLLVLRFGQASFIPFWDGLGGAGFQYYFWPRLIGKDRKYLARSIWGPLLVSVLIGGLAFMYSR